MNTAALLQILSLASGGVIACAVATLWRKDLRGIIRLLSMQGIFLGVVAILLAFIGHDYTLGIVALIVIAVKGILIPSILWRVVSIKYGVREVSPLVNIPSSLVIAAGLIVLSYTATRHLHEVFTNSTGSLAYLGFATVLIGFFTLTARTKSVSQIIGIVLIDNGITFTTFVLTGGLTLTVELGVTLDVLLVVIVLRIMLSLLQKQFGHTDLDQLRELHD